MITISIKALQGSSTSGKSRVVIAFVICNVNKHVVGVYIHPKSHSEDVVMQQ